MRLHDLRHTYASIALASGIHPKIVQDDAGVRLRLLRGAGRARRRRPVITAIERSAELARRIAAGEITDEQADQELDDDLGRIGDSSLGERKSLSP